MSTTSSRNFTTLYSGAGSVVPQGAYGNANVVSLLSVGTDGANTVGNITATGAVNTTGTMSATGNIETAGYFVGNFAGNITGNVTVPGANTQVLYNNAGNIGTTAGFTFVNTTGELDVPGAITAVGNVQGNYFIGNGSQLTGIAGTYGNANVVGLLSALGSNVISSTGNITTTANVSGGFILGNGSQLTGLPANYGNANVTTLLAAFGSNTISSTGNITTTANVAAGFFLGNGSQLTGLPATYGNANVTSLMAAFGSNIISSTGNITTTANIAGGFFLGDGSQLTNLPAGTYGNANVANFLGNGFGSNTISTTGNVSTGNVIVPNGSRYRGDFTAGTTLGRTFFQTTNTSTFASTFISVIPGPNHTASPGTIGSATGLLSTNDVGNASIFGMYSYPNDAAIRSLGSGTGSTNDITFKFGLFGTLAATVTQGGNIVAVGNLTSTQQTVVGTANVGTTGNIVVSGKNIATDMAFVPDGGNAATAATSRVVVGTGWLGNISHTARQNRLLVQDTFARGNTGTDTQYFAAEPIVSLTGNVTNASFRTQAISARVQIGGGSAANTINPTYATETVGAVAALQPNIDVGNASPYFLGNTVISQALLNGGFITVSPGSTVTNAYGMIPGIASNGAGANVTNYIGFASNLNGYAAGSVTGNVYGVYHGSNATLSTTGIATNNVVRSAPGYYAFYNADSVAQVQLGSLRSYNEFQYATATSGTVNIDKTNAQVQFIAPTANVTIGDFQNFVTTANDGTNNDTQSDTVTLIIQQGATPYTVTMPTGNASIKYASNVTTVGSTANSVTMVAITAIRSAGNAAIYLTTVSPEFV